MALQLAPILKSACEKQLLSSITNQTQQRVHLKVRQSEQICLSFDDLANPAYIAMTRGVGRELSATKYRLVLSSAFSSVEEIVKHLQTMGRGFADGLIISPIYSDERITKLISALQMPVVLVGTMPEGLDVDNVHVDSSAGVAMAIESSN
jgi:LacI family transcriptional regulator